MTDARIAYSIAKMKEYGIVRSGDTIEGRHWCHDRRTHEELLRHRWWRQVWPRDHRLQEGLQPTIREQGVV